MRRRMGFTLMELMIVIAIIMILTGAIVARITTGTEKAKYAKANGEMAEIAAAVRSLYMDTGYWVYYNASAAVGEAGLISIGNFTNTRADDGTFMQTTAAIQAKWKGPYLEVMETPKDPWGSNYYAIWYHDTNPRALYIFCYGPDSQFGEVNWNTGKVVEGSDSIMLLVHRFPDA